ncbi:hypothetical protein [Cumulibacter manganitolerans]|uniref:hypothetical protein n=1 Tax=Cumulibacter manganitolerans TaxID=1884992 RepID=UPI001296416B|nr:hypothetical protein [Cumulibacter manganitolerans]
MTSRTVPVIFEGGPADGERDQIREDAVGTPVDRSGELYQWTEETRDPTEPGAEACRVLRPANSL